METSMNGIVIVGAGECGTRAAFALRESGYGGRITLVGGEPQLPYERPPLSKPNSGGSDPKLICAAEALERADIEYFQGVEALAIDPSVQAVTLSDTTNLPYDKLLLATGARPRLLDCPGADAALYLRTHADAQAIFSRTTGGQRVAIIGGGLIGMELAAAFRSKNADAHVIEVAPKPFGRAVPTRFAELLHSRHLAEGVSFHLGQGVTEISEDGVTLADGSLVAADVIVAAIGVLPNIELAEAAGLTTGNGILTDTRLRTSAPNVYAAGDCALVTQPNGGQIRFESWRSARSQAETAARNMAGGAEDYAAMSWFWSDQYDLGLQVVGFPHPTNNTVLRSLPEGTVEFYLANGRLVAAAALGRGNSIAKDIKLAELLIAADVVADPAVLADEKFNLKTLLKSTRAA
jgi:3-phenylpropionate/trans-cinnamate dioxygenase ferredoxin reductase subunit